MSLPWGAFLVPEVVFHVPRGVSQVLRNSQEGSPCPVQRAAHEGTCVGLLLPKGSASKGT